MTKILNASIINPAANETFTGNIYIDGGIISKVEKMSFSPGEVQKEKTQAHNAENTGQKSENPEKNREAYAAGAEAGENKAPSGEPDEIFDASGLVVAPGLVDAHVHFRDPGQTEKEDILTGAKAAAHGGFTSVVMMGNTLPHPDTLDVIKYMIEKGRQTGIRVYPCANVTVGMQGKELTDMKALKEAGAVLFTDDGLPIMDEELFKRACAKAAELGVMISLHEEDPAFVYDAGVNEGEAAKKLGLRGASRDAEIKLAERDIRIAIEEGADIMIQHISAAETVELIRNARKKHKNIHGESTPHHFTLTEEAVLKYGTFAKVNPPLRTEKDRTAIIAGIADGTLEQIATDHAPHTSAEKAKPFKQAPSGMTGLETSLGLGIRELVMPGHITLMQLITAMSGGPARLSKISGGKIAEKEPADLIIFDPNESFTADEFFSKASNTPFKGEKLFGGIHRVYCGGKKVYSAGDAK